MFFIVYDAFIGAEINLRQKGAHKAQREELETVLYLLEKVLLFLPEHLGRKWQYHAMGRLMSKLLHPGKFTKYIRFHYLHRLSDNIFLNILKVLLKVFCPISILSTQHLDMRY